MRKKYLSALLFGALLFASAGTFTSCKDYDDDINNLQSQITANADAIKALQDKINAGKWITELTAVEGGFKVTFSDGQSFEIVNGAAGENGTQITIGEDGYWYFDGVKSEYKAVVDGAQNKVIVPTVGEDGYWYLVNAETGELVKSEYKANGAAYAVEANGGYNIYMPGEDGKMLDPIYVPGAAGSITSMNAELREEGAANGLSINLYTFSPSDTDKKAWKDLTGKDVTSNKYILSSAEKIGLRINPVNVDASGINFVLYNSKNEKLPGVTFAAAEYKDYVTATRAAYGNGLYSLSMKPFELKDDAAKDELTDLFTSSSKSILYAVSADVNVRAEYNIAIADLASKTAAIGDVTINEEAIVDDNNTTTVTTDKKNKTAVDTKTANVVSVETPADLYDMWLTAEEEDVNLFKLVFDQEKHTFTINADPDVLTKAYFVLTVHTMDNSGKLAEQEVNIYVSDRIAAEAEYAKRTLNVVENKDDKSDANVFKADMATMTNALGDQLDAWKRKVSTSEVVYYSDAECKTKVADAAASGIELTFIGADGKNAEIKNAADMKFYVTNADASQKFKVDNTYYAKVTFNGADGELNSVVIPFEFKIPALSTMLTPRAGYVSDGVINAYFYDTTTNGGTTAVELNRYFTINNDAVKESAVDFTDDNKYSDGAYLEETSDVTFGTSKVDIIGDFKDNKVPAGYGKAVTIKLSNEKYLGWSYQADADKVYTFKICLMSPIYEGTIAPVSGTSISISANDVVNGAKITDKDITGVDYNGNKYCVVSDNEKATGDTPNATWYKNSQIKSVTMTKDKDSYIDNVTYQKATSSDNGTVNGWFIVKGRSLSVTQEIELPVTVEDAWGYKKTVNVPATIVVK